MRARRGVAAADADPQDSAGLYVVIHSGAILREGKDVSSAIVGRLQYGEELTVVQVFTDQGSAKVRGLVDNADGLRGWISLYSQRDDHRLARKAELFYPDSGSDDPSGPPALAAAARSRGPPPRTSPPRTPSPPSSGAARAHQAPAAEHDLHSEVGSLHRPVVTPQPGEKLIRSAAPPGGKPGAADADAHGGQEQRLGDGVFLIKKAQPKGFLFTYEVVNKKLGTLCFTCDLKGSSNMAWQKRGGGQARGSLQEVTVKVKPGHQALLGTIGPARHDKGSSLKLGFRWTFESVSREEVKAQTAAEDKERRRIADRMERDGVVASRVTSAEDIRKRCKRMGSNWVDPEFFPDDRALFNRPEDSGHPAVVWKRPRDFVPQGEKPQLFSDAVSPLDIKQGALGDCWFLAALAGLAEFKERVERIFGKQRYNEEGVYEIQCFKNGMPVTVIVDDFFPCSPQSGRPCYSHADHELWVPVLEKAWAKLHGSYEQIEAGLPYRALMDMLGAAGKNFCFKTGAEGMIPGGTFFKTLSQYDDRGYILCAGTPGEDHMTKSHGERPKAGIVPGHAYSVLAVKQAGDTQLLCLRNPWGTFEWDGDWSDSSPKWTPELKKQLDYSPDPDDGEFWMSYQDFLSHYDCCGAVFFSEKWSESRISIETSDDYLSAVLEFEVEAEASAFFTLMQRDTRIKGAPPYIELAFAVYGPLDGDGHPARELLRSHCWSTRELVEEALGANKLKPGRYLFAAFNPARVERRTIAAIIQLDESGKERKHHVSTTQRKLDGALRDSLLMASACASSSAKAGEIGPLKTWGAFLPGMGYVFAACAKSGEVDATVDFSSCSGLFPVDPRSGGRGDKTVKVRLSSAMKLVAELEPDPKAQQFSFGTRVSYKQSSKR